MRFELKVSGAMPSLTVFILVILRLWRIFLLLRGIWIFVLFMLFAICWHCSVFYSGLTGAFLAFLFMPCFFIFRLRRMLSKSHFREGLTHVFDGDDMTLVLQNGLTYTGKVCDINCFGLVREYIFLYKRNTFWAIFSSFDGEASVSKEAFVEYLCAHGVKEKKPLCLPVRIASAVVVLIVAAAWLFASAHYDFFEGDWGRTRELPALVVRGELFTPYVETTLFRERLGKSVMMQVYKTDPEDDNVTTLYSLSSEDSLPEFFSKLRFTQLDPKSEEKFGRMLNSLFTYSSSNDPAFSDNIPHSLIYFEFSPVDNNDILLVSMLPFRRDSVTGVVICIFTKDATHSYFAGLAPESLAFIKEKYPLLLENAFIWSVEE